MYFVCRRSCETQHYNVHREERLIRVHPSVKMSENCLSWFRVCIHNNKNGEVSATFYHHHTGHNPDADHFNILRLSTAVLNWIDSMILQGIPSLTIVQNLSSGSAAVPGADFHEADVAFDVPDAAARRLRATASVVEGRRTSCCR